MNTKKQSERFQLERFISNEELELRVRKIINHESPDFIVETLDKRVSIEHTKLIHPKLKKIEVFNSSIIKEAEKQFQENYKDVLYVLISLDRNLNNGSSTISNYSDRLFACIEEIYLANRNFQFQVMSNRIRWRHPFIENLSVNNIMGFSNWQHFGAYPVDHIDEGWLQSRINKKEKGLIKYEDDFDENWLLMVSNFGSKASAYNYDFMKMEGIESRFDRIFIYQFMPDKILRIK